MVIKCAINYAIVSGKDLSELCQNVREYLKNLNGWEPSGSIYEVGDGKGSGWFVQPLTRYAYTDPAQSRGTIWPE